MEQFKGKGPVSYDSNLPHLAFGNFKNCVGDKWPANMCSLKIVKDVKNVTYYVSSEYATEVYVVCPCYLMAHPCFKHFCKSAYY